MKSLLRNNPFWKYTLLILAAVLFTLSFIFNRQYSHRSSIADEVKQLESYIHEHQRSFDRFVKDTGLISRLVDNRESEAEFNRITSEKYGIFLYTINNKGSLDLRFWNNQVSLPPRETFQAGDLEELRELPNGHYLVIKRSITAGESTIVVYGMVLIRSGFFLETEYLPDQFTYDKAAINRVEIARKVTEFPVHSLSNQTLFYLDQQPSGGVPLNNRITILLRFSGLLLLLLFIHLVAEVLGRKHLARGIIFLAVALLALRMIIYLMPSLLNLRQFELFDPSIYGSNLIQRSLGDLLMNSVFFCWLVVFTWNKIQHINISSRLGKWQRWVAGVLSVLLLIFCTFILSSVIRSIVADSKISFDVINFYSLDRYTVVGFIVLATLSLSYYYLSQLLFRIIFPLFEKNTWPVYFTIAFTGLVYLTIKSGDPTVLFYIPVLVWLLIYTGLVNREGLILNRIRINIAGILFWIFVFSISIAAIMVAENKKAEWAKRKYYAEKLAIQTDPSSERLMSIALKYLDKDFLTANFHRFGDSATSRQLRDSILNGNYSGYLDKYATTLYVYDEAGVPLYNEDNTTFVALNTIVSLQSKPTTTEDLYYYETAFDKYTYITQKKVVDSLNNVIGHFFVLSNPKRYSSDAIFPELFKLSVRNDPESSPIYAYGVYSKKRLVTQSNNYPFATRLSTTRAPGDNEFTRVSNDEYDELWYWASNERVVVLARKRDTLIESITLFSYIFCSFLFLVFIVQILSLLVRATYDFDGFRRFFHFNIRNQVHSTIIFVSIFSFIIIGIATINFFKSRYNRTNSDKLSRTMNIMVNEMEKRVNAHSAFDDVLMLYDSVSNYSLQNLVDEIADIHGVDVNVYDLKGDLQVSSEVNIYTKGVLSTKMHPVAYYHLNRLKQIEHVQEESIANLSYQSIYAPVIIEETGQEYAYLSIPYFTSQGELNQEISNFIVTVINLNAFILLVAGLIALFITNRITRSFSIISSKMKDVNLGKLNEEIEWSRDDEIGDLVTEYNKMVTKLGESASALAKTEREGAWREMARQVAHEIKNPLTPMKLSIQYLQKAIDGNHPNVKELSGNVAKTLVEQIDHLSKIAADFSQFANIGYTNVEEFDLHNVLGSLKDLYQADPAIRFIWNPLPERLMVLADRTQMNRLFTNLFANAKEACKDQVCIIEVDEVLEDGMVRISIRDNGEGIAEEMQSRIFIPNFTTKSSGTGLGLAMCKGIVEQAKGNIWFETTKDVGTTFFVTLPVLS